MNNDEKEITIDELIGCLDNRICPKCKSQLIDCSGAYGSYLSCVKEKYYGGKCDFKFDKNLICRLSGK